MPSLFKQRTPSRELHTEVPGSGPVTPAPGRRSNGEQSRPSQARVEVRREFLKTTTKGTQDEIFTNVESLPSLDVAYEMFRRMYPKFAETSAIDDLRERDYYHLEEGEHVCLDYCGFGLFSYHQQVINRASSSFGLAYISANLPTHALYGAAEEGTVEHYIRKRVMDYLNINDTEYSMVFTTSRGSAFKLLAESYPFHVSRKLLTVYDFESEAVNWMVECAKQKGAKIMTACFKWPSLRIGTTHLKKQLAEKKKKNEAIKGLFVFPVQSRMTGAKYSYQWMSQAQQNKWHVLLDASALGPKDMDSLGLSLFRPDFIVTSFYKIFGTDPTGFGCLFIKNSAISSLQNSSRARAVGMVRIVSISRTASDDFDQNESEEKFQKESWRSRQQPLSSFSGPFFPAAIVGETKVEYGQVQRENGNSDSGHLSPNHLQAEIDEDDEGPGPYDNEYGAQLTESRYYYPEMMGGEIEEDDLEFATSRLPGIPHHEWSALEEIKEEEDEEDEETGAEPSNDPPLRLFPIEKDKNATTSGAHDEVELDVESGPYTYREVEGVSESGLHSEAQGTEDRMPVFDGSPDAEVADLGRGVEHEADEAAETAEADVSYDQDLQHLSSSERIQAKSEVIGEEIAVMDVGEYTDNNSPNAALDEQPHEENQKSMQFRIASFDTGKEISDFVEMGVRGLVQKFQRFQSFHTGNKLSTGVEALSAGKEDMSLYEPRGSQLGNAGPVLGTVSAVVEAGANDGIFKPEVAGVQRRDRNISGRESLPADIEEDAGGSVLESRDEENSEVLRRGELVEMTKGSALESDASLGDGGLRSAELSHHTCESEIENSEMMKRGKRDTENMATETSSDTKRENVSDSGRLVDESDRHAEVSGDLQRRNGSESWEENYITNLLQVRGEVDKFEGFESEGFLEARASGSGDLSSANEGSSKEFMPARDHFSPHSSPEAAHRITSHAESVSVVDETSRELEPLENDNVNSGEGRSSKDISSSDIHEANLQEWRHGRSDLRSSRTLLRDVDFEDEMFSCRGSNASDMEVSGRASIALAEDVARLEMEDSDDDSFHPSQFYSGSLHSGPLHSGPLHSGSLHSSRNLLDDVPASRYVKEEEESDVEFDDLQEPDLWEGQRDLGVLCKGLDLADSLGLTKLNYRVRYLINWLVNSLLKLRHPGPDTDVSLVRIYGPKVKYDRGGAVSFNMFDLNGILIQPGVVQRLADRSNVSLGVGRLCNIVDPDVSADFLAEKERVLESHRADQGLADAAPSTGKSDVRKSVAGSPVAIPVVTAALGFVTSFEDVYKLWSFLAKFLDADFVSNEVWRYHSLNQQTIVL